ncbi:MAG: hypothetical protein J6D23_02890 [Clostridia bacterium]|nr:hypothetical protein [Clostridia bacterium]
MNRETAKNTLQRFCSFPIGSSREVMEEFSALNGAVSVFDGDHKNFVYVPGTRQDRALLVAHADTVWDKGYHGLDFAQELIEENGVFKSKSSKCGIGADDRAGCAILWLLKDMGHSLLVVDGEEHGQIGSNHIKNEYPELFNELNSHSYIMQFDRRENKNYKCYKLPVSQEFIEFVEKETGYYNAGSSAFTDIVTLCRDICGVNLSIGYYLEHSELEHIVFEEWLGTLEIAEAILKKEQQKFPLNKNS